MSKKLKLHHSNRWQGFIGLIESEEMYEEVKQGKRDWETHQKPNIKSIQIPYEIFDRLLRLDRTITTIPFEIEVERTAGDNNG